MASRASRPPSSAGSSSEESLVLDVRQECHHVGMRPDHVRDVEQRQPHFRRDVAGDGLRERVGCVLLAQPLLQPLVQPPGGLHPRQDRREALRVEQEPPQLLDVREDEVGQRRSGLGPDVALQGGDRGLAALDQPGDDRRIGLDRGRLAAGRHLARGPVWPGRDEVAAFDDGPQCVPEQRIGSPRDVQQARATRGRPQRLGDVDEQSPAGLGHRPRGSSAAKRRARGALSGRSSSAGDRRRCRRGYPGRSSRGWGTAW